MTRHELIRSILELGAYKPSIRKLLRMSQNQLYNLHYFLSRGGRYAS